MTDSDPCGRRYGGDLTGDGVPDVIESTEGRGPVHLLAGPFDAPGSGEPIVIFAETWLDDLDAARVEPVGLVDFDGDGQLDLLTSTVGKESGGTFWNAGGVAVWLGPITGPRDVGAPDAVAYGRARDEAWAFEGVVDLNGDGVDELVMRSHEVGNTVYTGCGIERFGGALAALETGWQGVISISSSDILVYGDDESNTLGRPFAVHTAHGADELAVTLPAHGETYDCEKLGSTGRLRVEDPGIGGVGLVRLR